MPWGPVFTSIVRALVDGDFALESAAPEVERLSAANGERLRGSVSAYGPVTLVELPEATWEASVAMWYVTYWQTMVDLWTAEVGRSDLVLHTDVRETAGGFSYAVYAIYVP